MSISNPGNQNPSNPGVATPITFGQASVPSTTTASPLNQIRGVSAKNSTGAGIPRHVTNVSASISAAAKGATSTVTVKFSRDPSDTSFSGVNVFVRGYQANNSNVQVGGGADSPITLILNNTGESVNVSVQAQGNAGVAPIATAPSTGIKLPTSSTGGFGTTTVISYSAGNPPPPSLPPATFMYGPGVLNFAECQNLTQSVNLMGTTGTNAVVVSKFYIPTSIVVNKYSWFATSTPSHYAFGIYDSNGNKVVDTGVLTHAGGSNISGSCSTAATLSAGYYYLAWTSDSGSLQGSGFAITANSLTMTNANSTKLAVAANASSAGALPSTLGVLTATSNTASIACPMWET